MGVRSIGLFAVTQKAGRRATSTDKKEQRDSFLLLYPYHCTLPYIQLYNGNSCQLILLGSRPGPPARSERPGRPLWLVRRWRESHRQERHAFTFEKRSPVCRLVSRLWALQRDWRASCPQRV